MYKLYCSKGAGSVAPQVMLEEVGARYEKVEIDLDKEENKSADFLAVNPMGQIPALADDPELVRDKIMLAEYRRVLGDYPLWHNDRSIAVHLSRSLVYAGKVKLPPGAGLMARR